jgi:tRNA U34 5-carboxymethylaminomethyl modifying enzyme MnmG/GidA
MNEGGDGFEEGWRTAVGAGLLRLLGGVEKVFERLRTILSRGDAFVGVLAVYDLSTTARGMEEGVGGVFLRGDVKEPGDVEIPDGF